jgi:hypothetical protein
MPDYKLHDPRGWCGDPSRGAALGRASFYGDPNFAGPLTLQRVHLDDGGYDVNGTYFGSGREPLYWCASDDCEIDFMLRAASWDAAADQVRARYPRAKVWAPLSISQSDLDAMLDAYIDTALWSETGDDDRPLDDTYCATDLGDEARAAMRADCEAFAKAHEAKLLLAMQKDPDLDWGQAGHDFWLTRNGHGAGFWDGDWPEPEGATLTEGARKHGEVHLYVGDDGAIYCV